MPYADPIKQREYLTRYARTWYWRNREKDLARQKTWRTANREKLLALGRAFREKNKKALAMKQTERRLARPEHVATINRRSVYKTRYGITLEQFDVMLREQDGKCAICGTTKPGGRWARFAVDHCHVTGMVRGLLCIKCNSSLGWFETHQKNTLAYLTRKAVANG